MSAKYNLVCDQATTFNWQFQILNDSIPWNLANYTGTMTVRPFIGASTTTVVASTDNGRMYLSQVMDVLTSLLMQTQQVLSQQVVMFMTWY